MALIVEHRVAVVADREYFITLSLANRLLNDLKLLL